MESSRLKEQKSEFPLRANSAIKQMEYLQVEIGLARPKIYNCINLTTKYEKSPPGMKGFQSLGDIDEVICDYASRFRDTLSNVQDFISDNLLTRMEKNKDFEDFDRFNGGIEELRAKMADIPAKVFDFQKEMSVVESKPNLAEALMKKHKAEEKQNIDLIYNKIDIIRRYFNQLCKPEQERTCRI